MKIIILGAGRVGESVADSLVSERNDITVIDTDARRLRDLESRFDLRGVVGNGIEPAVLAEAGARDTDLLIACAALDETNLVCCKVAQRLFSIPTRIARVRSAGFQDDALMGPEGLAVDRIICPEESLTRYIGKLIEYPEAMQVRQFAGGRACLVAVRAPAGAPRVSQGSWGQGALRAHRGSRGGARWRGGDPAGGPGAPAGARRWSAMPLANCARSCQTWTCGWWPFTGAFWMNPTDLSPVMARPEWSRATRFLCWPPAPTLPR